MTMFYTNDIPKHKVFLSFHHQDEAYRQQFESQFSNEFNGLKSVSQLRSEFKPMANQKLSANNLEEAKGKLLAELARQEYLVKDVALLETAVAQLQQTKTVAGFEKNVATILVAEVSAQKKILAANEQPSTAKLVLNSVGNGMAGNFKSSKNRLSEARAEYSKKKQEYEKGLLSIGDFFATDYQKIIQNRIKTTDIFLKDLKTHLKLSTGIKSQKL